MKKIGGPKGLFNPEAVAQLNTGEKEGSVRRAAHED